MNYYKKFTVSVITLVLNNIVGPAVVLAKYSSKYTSSTWATKAILLEFLVSEIFLYIIFQKTKEPENDIFSIAFPKTRGPSIFKERRGDWLKEYKIV